MLYSLNDILPSINEKKYHGSKLAMVPFFIIVSPLKSVMVMTKSVKRYHSLLILMK